MNYETGPGLITIISRYEKFFQSYSLIFLTMVLEFLGYHDYYVPTITFFFCVGCDFLAAMIALMAVLLQLKKIPKANH
jgi:hypothetical protein